MHEAAGGEGARPEELEQLRRDNRRLAHQLAEAQRLQEAVLSTLSHELRTPLTAILGWAQLLRGGKAGPASLPRALESIERNARLQARLIEDLLDAARLASGSLTLALEPVLLGGPVERAVEEVRPVADARRVVLRVESEPFGLYVAADPARLTQLVRHLMDNAVKFSPEGGAVTVHVASQERWGELTVTDEGPGIPEEFRPFLFERFRQADGGPTRAHGGLGLGLSIVRRLVDLHGGTIEAMRPASGRGTCFRVRLPLAGAPGLAQESEPAPTVEAGPEVPSLEGVTVLLVDDEPETLEVIAGLLDVSGARVLMAGSAEEALSLLEHQPVDVLLSDLRMPRQDGFALLRAVRALPDVRRAATPAIALTAASSARERVQAVAAGFHFHVPKPVDRAELAVVVRRLVPAAPEWSSPAPGRRTGTEQA